MPRVSSLSRGDTPVLAHWHGQYRTDGFSTTVAELKAKAKEFAT
jgi:hypothetical protein